MNTVKLTEKEFEKLNKLDIRGAQNTESEIYVLDTWKYKNKNLLLKYLNEKEGEAFSSKLATVSLMIDKKDEIKIDELVLPNNLVVINDEVVGFTVPYVRGTRTLTEVLNDNKVSISNKIKYLKKIGKTLRKIEALKRKNIIDLTIGDLHEDNILITKDNNIKFIDLDGAYINNNYPQGARYLYNEQLRYIKKYKYKNDLICPNKTTDLYCYNMIIINMIARSRMDSTNIPDYFNYTSYLISLGFDKHLIDSFRRIYSDGPNVNPEEYLERIDKEELSESSYNKYAEKVYGLKLF